MRVRHRRRTSPLALSVSVGEQRESFKCPTSSTMRSLAPCTTPLAPLGPQSGRRSARRPAARTPVAQARSPLSVSVSAAAAPQPESVSRSRGPAPLRAVAEPLGASRLPVAPSTAAMRCPGAQTGAPLTGVGAIPLRRGGVVWQENSGGCAVSASQRLFASLAELLFGACWQSGVDSLLRGARRGPGCAAWRMLTTCGCARLRRNIAIIAHVDHGKTTLVDSMLKQSKARAGCRGQNWWLTTAPRISTRHRARRLAF